MKSFKAFLKESKEDKFDHSTNHGWIHDNDHYTLYHGTHKNNLQSILKNGINKFDPTTGMISLTPDPHTAHGYAAMSASGGEHHFRGTQGNPKLTPHEDRVTLKLKIPKDWIESHKDVNMRGNIGIAAGTLTNKDKFDTWKKSNPNKSDHEYYAMSEIRVNKSVPPEFIHSYSFKSKK